MFHSDSFVARLLWFSAGIGRSGTFVTLLWLMQLSMRGIPPDIKGAVRDLRLHRMSMVQTLVSLHCTSLKYTAIRIFLKR